MDRFDVEVAAGEIRTGCVMGSDAMIQLGRYLSP